MLFVDKTFRSTRSKPSVQQHHKIIIPTVPNADRIRYLLQSDSYQTILKEITVNNYDTIWWDNFIYEKRALEQTYCFQMIILYYDWKH